MGQLNHLRNPTASLFCTAFYARSFEIPLASTKINGPKLPGWCMELWLVVDLPLKNMESQWEGWHPIYYGKKIVPNHQPDY